jgi:sterol desaturase/sphingolipid hydroxylase (fatty acid hydroxylase superfamily)
MDFSLPIFWQVGRLGDRYWAWIHEPVDFNMRLFQADFFEFFTRNKWYMIPMIWMPLVLGLVFSGYTSFSSMLTAPYAIATTVCLFLCGILGWTLLEYVLHRFVFHWEPSAKSPTQLTFHFLLHGIHHKSPMDPDRLVFPPALAVVIITLFYGLFSTTLPWPVASSFGGGMLMGYVLYDVTHFYLHHGKPQKDTYYHVRKSYHQAHHYKQQDLGYGISTVIWDQVFNTVGLAS